jgi:tripartite-type tricarboxylate transporter receptor subunit TctC
MPRETFKLRLVIGCLSISLCGAVLTAAAAYAQTPYYQGKTITIIQGRSAGGTGDFRVRAIMPLLQKYIPGNPTIVNDYMVGGGGRKATNHLFRTSRPDGLTIGNMGIGMVSAAILGETGVLYDLDKLNYLGAPLSTRHTVFLTRGEMGLSSVEKLQGTAGIRIAAESVGHSGYIEGRIFGWLLRLKEPRFVTGYASAEIDAALLRGEVDAHSTNSDSIVQRYPEWLDKKLMHFHANLPVPRGHTHPRFTHLPDLDKFAVAPLEQRLLAMHRAFRLPGQPFIAPPGVPKEPLKILQEAFRKAYNDPEFHANYKKLVGDDPSPLMPEELERAVREMPRDAETVDLYKRIAGHVDLPRR